METRLKQYEEAIQDLEKAHLDYVNEVAKIRKRYDWYFFLFGIAFGFIAAFFA